MNHSASNSLSLNPGKLFVFEGADDVGKTTLAKRLVSHLAERGMDCLYASFPGREAGTIGHLVYQVHHYEQAGEIAPVNPTALQLLHIAAHVDTIENRILPALNAGQCVILDRFWWSTWVYGSADGSNQQSLAGMIRLEQEHWQGVKPEAVFHIHRKTPVGEPLTLPAALAWKRWQSEYWRLARTERKHYSVIDISNDGPLDKTFDSLLELVSVNSRM